MSEIHVQTVDNIVHPDTGLSVGMKIHQTRESLRDQFAGQAMQGEIITGGGPVEEVAKWAYAQADAMLAAREKGAK